MCQLPNGTFQYCLFHVACFLGDKESVCEKWTHQHDTSVGQRQNLSPYRNHVVESKYPWWHHTSFMCHGSMPKGYDYNRYLSYPNSAKWAWYHVAILAQWIDITGYQECRQSFWLAYWEFGYGKYCNNFVTVTAESSRTMSTIARCMYTCIFGNWLGLSGTILCKLYTPLYL